MVAVGGSGDGIEAVDDEVRLEIADNPHDVGKQFLTVPVVEGFVRVFAEAEVQCAGKKLLASVGLPCPEEFMGTDIPQLDAKFLANEVLSAVAPRQGHIGDLGMFGIGQIGYQARIFIIGMCCHEENTLGVLKSKELVVELGRWVGICKNRGNNQAENIYEPVFFCGHGLLDLR